MYLCMKVLSEIGGLFVIISVGAPRVFLGISICILVETPLEKHLLFRSLPFFPRSFLCPLISKLCSVTQGELGKGGRSVSCFCMNSSKFKLIVSGLGEKASGWKNCTLSLVSKKVKWSSGDDHLFLGQGENGHMDWKLMGLFGCSLDFVKGFSAPMFDLALSSLFPLKYYVSLLRDTG